MRRRQFISAAALISLWPRPAWPQQAGRTYRVGLMIGETLTTAAALPAFREELARFGFVEGRNLVLDMRRAQQDRERLEAAARDLVRGGADLIVASTASAVDAAVAGTTSTPIVIWANNFDPIARGYVQGLAHPGGRVTGVFSRQLELAEKQVELLNDAFPHRKRIAMLWDSGSAEQYPAAAHRAKALGLEPISIRFDRTPYDIPGAYQAMKAQSAELVLVLSTPFLALYQDRIVELAAENRLPTMFILRTYVLAGGLMSYGVPVEATFRRVANFVGRILQGSKPADLPLEQPNQYHLAINLKTAQRIGVELPTSILLRADEVIE